MLSTPPPQKVNLVELAHDAARLAQQSSELVAKIALLASAPAVNLAEFIDEKQLFGRYGLKKNSADNAGIPRKRIGRKSQWLVADVEDAIARKPVQSRPPRKSKPIGINEDPLDQMIAHGELVARGHR